MKIGILTFHRANNCGAVLQCYALQEAIKSLGHEVCIIDYRQPYIERLYSIRTPLYPRSTFLNRCIINLRSLFSFSRFRKKYLNVSDLVKDGIFPECDIYVIGSDQVWSEKCTGEFDKVYYGYFKRDVNSKVIGYSISCPIESLYKLGADRLKESLQNFDSISFREKILQQYLSGALTLQGYVTSDPTLLMDSTFWDKIIGRRNKRTGKGGVLIYLYKYRISESDLKKIKSKASGISEALGVNCNDLSTSIHSPEQFLTSIRDASYIITNSFHAIVFSLLFKKRFSAIVSNDGLDSRYEDLIKSLNAGSVLMTPETLAYSNNLDYESIQKPIESMRDQSLDFLRKALSH